MHQSIATIASPEFINLQPLDINPLMSRCEIKVLYLGDNRNRSYISKDVAREMSKTLRGAPIVGYFKEDTQDFGDHGDRITIEGGEIKFESLTRPYGFVDPAAKVWFQKFIDMDEYGNEIEREYLMTTGYLWTGQYEECKSAVEGDGKPHSMELDKKTLKGEWAQNLNTDIEFFIINDAIFSKLCMLGDVVEPCFEGSSITAPRVSSSFSLDDEFRNTLFSMMQDLKIALEGGHQMTLENKDGVTEVFSAEQDKANKTVELENQNITEGNSDQTSFAAEAKKEEEEKKESEDTSKESAPEKKNEEEDKEKKANFVKEEDDKKKEDEKEDKEESVDNDDDDDKDDSDDDEDKKKANFALENELAELKIKYSQLEADYNALVSFKNQIENEKKDALIQSFYMLSDEDKADVIANKANYSLDDIESKLSVICVRKKVNFTVDEEETKTDDPITTFSLDGATSVNVPDWIKAVRRTAQDRH